MELVIDLLFIEIHIRGVTQNTEIIFITGQGLPVFFTSY